MVTNLGIDDHGMRALHTAGLKVKRGGAMIPHPAPGFSLATMTIPKFREYSANNIPEVQNGPANVPLSIQDNDMMLFYIFGQGNVGTGGPSGAGAGAGWTNLISQARGGSYLAVWWKRWHTGDAMTVPVNNIGGTGLYGIVAYSNVDHVHADLSVQAVANSNVSTPPSSWATVPVGSRAVVFQANDNNGDWPLHIGAENWRTDVDGRRWNNGGVVLTTADPAVWSVDCALYLGWGNSNLGGIMLVGPTAYGSSWDAIVPTIRPTAVGGGGYGWNSNPTGPYGGPDANVMQAGDLWLVATGTNGVSGAMIGVGESGDSGWWLLSAYHPSFGAYVHGRFVTAAEAAANAISSRHSLVGTQSHGAAWVRGVNPHCPVRRQIERGWANNKTFADVTAGVKTILGCVVGSDAHTNPYTNNFDHVYDHVRWNPMGSMMFKDVTDGQVVSALHVQGREGEGVASSLFEMRGK